MSVRASSSWYSDTPTSQPISRAATCAVSGLLVATPAIRTLSAGRVAAIIADLASTLHFARKNELEIRPILPSYSADRLYTSFNKDKAALQRTFDRAFHDLMAEGFVDRIYRE